MVMKQMTIFDDAGGETMEAVVEKNHAFSMSEEAIQDALFNYEMDLRRRNSGAPSVRVEVENTLRAAKRPLSNSEIQEYIRGSGTTVGKSLNQLMAAGRVIKSGRGKYQIAGR